MRLECETRKSPHFLEGCRFSYAFTDLEGLEVVAEQELDLKFTIKQDYINFNIQEFT